MGAHHVCRRYLQSVMNKMSAAHKPIASNKIVLSLFQMAILWRNFKRLGSGGNHNATETYILSTINSEKACFVEG